MKDHSSVHKQSIASSDPKSSQTDPTPDQHLPVKKEISQSSNRGNSILSTRRSSSFVANKVIKKLRPTHNQTRTNTMADGSNKLASKSMTMSSAENVDYFFDNEQDSRTVTDSKPLGTRDSLTNSMLNDVFTTQESQEQSKPKMTTEMSSNYEEDPKHSVLVQITAASSVTGKAEEGEEEGGGGGEEEGRGKTPMAMEQTITTVTSDEPSVAPIRLTETNDESSEVVDELEQLAQRSIVSGGESVSLREEDDGVDSMLDIDTESVGRRKSGSAGMRDSGTINSSVDKEPFEPSATHRTNLSSAKSVRIMDTPTIFDTSEPRGHERDELVQWHEPHHFDDEETDENNKRIWVDALGRAHTSSNQMKQARPLARLKMKSSIVHVRSVQEQVHKNVSQYEKQRALIEELKLLKRLQISKKNGVDPQYLTRSFSTLAKRNTLISNSGGIDDAEKLIYGMFFNEKKNLCKKM